jgi:hypothetical protein
MKNPSENKSLTSFLFLLSVILSILALLYRKPEAFTKPQFWAEDGVIFFQQYFQTGVSSIFNPYAGYLHLIPRLVALLTFHSISFEHMPAAYNVASLLIFLGLVCFIWWRTRFDPYTKFFVIMALSLVPVGSEMVLNITNVQWYVSLFIPLLFLAGHNKKYRFFDGIVLFLVALTGPFSVIFLPAVCAIVWYRSRKLGEWKNERWLFFVYLIATFIQLLVLAFSTTREVSGWSIGEKIAHSPRMLYLHLTNLLGVARFYVEGIHKGLFGILLLAMLGWFFFCWRKLTREKNLFPFFLMLAAICNVAANVYALGPNMYPHLNPIHNGMRYFFGPCVLFLWSVFAYSTTPCETRKEGEIPTSFHTLKIMAKANIRNIAFLLLFAYYTGVLVLTIPVFGLADFNWPEQAKKIESFQKGHLEIPINPHPVKMSFDK